MATDKNLERAVLWELELVHPYLQTESALHQAINLRLPKPFTLTELRTVLTHLEAKRQILSVRDSDDEVRWKITDNGIARLKERA